MVQFETEGFYGLQFGYAVFCVCCLGTGYGLQGFVEYCCSFGLLRVFVVIAVWLCSFGSAVWFCRLWLFFGSRMLVCYSMINMFGMVMKNANRFLALGGLCSCFGIFFSLVSIAKGFTGF